MANGGSTLNDKVDMAQPTANVLTPVCMFACISDCGFWGKSFKEINLCYIKRDLYIDNLHHFSLVLTSSLRSSLFYLHAHGSSMFLSLTFSLFYVPPRSTSSPVCWPTAPIVISTVLKGSLRSLLPWIWNPVHGWKYVRSEVIRTRRRKVALRARRRKKW